MNDDVGPFTKNKPATDWVSEWNKIMQDNYARYGDPDQLSYPMDNDDYIPADDPKDSNRNTIMSDWLDQSNKNDEWWDEFSTKYLNSDDKVDVTKNEIKARIDQINKQLERLQAQKERLLLEWLK